MLAHAEAHAGECTLQTPECHLENGRELLGRDPKHAAEELLASYKLDERTDTLALYATALQADRRYAHALETWQRVIVFRESELDAAKAATRKATGRKLAAARTAVTSTRKQMEQAAAAIIELWPNVGRVRIRIPAGQQLAVSRDGVEVDVSRDVLVNAGRDELVFARKDGSVQRVVVEVAAGASAKIDAPPEPVAKPAPQQPLKLEQPRPAVAEPRPAEPRPKPVAPRPAAPKAAEPEPKAADPEPKAAEPEPEAPAPALASALATGRSVEEPRSRTMSRVGLGLTVGGAVAVGIAGGLGYLASRDYDRAREIGCSSDGQCPIGPAADLAERSNDRARLAQISAVGGGAMIATGVVMWIVGRGKTRRAAADVTLRVNPSSAAIAWRF